MHPQKERVHDHADGRHEERGEHVAHRLDVLQRLLRERRRAHHHARHERAELDGQPQFLAAPRHHQAKRDGHHLVQLGLDAARGHRAEQPPHERLAEPDGCGKEGAHQHADAQHRHHAFAHAVRAPEHGQQREEQADRAVLQDERADCDLAMRRLRGAALSQALDHHRGAGHGEERAHEDALLAGRAGEVRDDAAHQHHERDLHGPAEHRHGLHVPQLREGKLDAEREEQKDDPELRQRLHLHELHDESEAAGPDERAGDEVPGDQRLAHQREHHRASRGRDEDDHQVADQTQVLLQLHRAGLGVGDDKLVVTRVHQPLDVFIHFFAPERAVDVLRARLQALEQRLRAAVFGAGRVPAPVAKAAAEIAIPLHHLVHDTPARPADAHDRLQLAGSLGLVERPARALAQDTALLLIGPVELLVQRFFDLRRERLLEVRVRLRGHGLVLIARGVELVLRARGVEVVVTLFRGAGESRILRRRSTKGTRRKVRELERRRSFR